MRIAALTVLVVLLAASPAPAACERRDSGERYEVSLLDDGRSNRVRACDHRRGELRTLARTTSEWASGRAPRFDDVAVHGARAAWITVDPRDTVAVATLTTMRLPGGRRRTTRLGGLRLDRTPDTTATRLGVTYTRAGGLAHSVWETGDPTGRTRRLVVRGRVVARGPIGSLHTDDRWTLRWYDGTGSVSPAFVDLNRPPLRDGCPARPLFGDRRWYGDVLVSTAQYRGSTAVTRVCRRGSGRDRVLLVWGDMDTWGNGTGLRVLGGGDGLLTYEVKQASRYDGCSSRTRFTVEVETLRVVERSERLPC